MSKSPKLTWRDRLFGLRMAEEAHEPGATTLKHFTRETDGALTRFHLRVEPDGGGMLLANAANALRLSPSGALMAEGLLAGQDDTTVAQTVCGQFVGVGATEVLQHLGELRAVIDLLANPDDNYPVSNFDDPEVSAHARALGAPYRADVPAGDPDQVLPLLTKLWEIGIPHVCFLAPGNAESARLVRLVERAEDLGMICGVRGRATDFGNAETVHALAQAGVDHLTYLLASPREIHSELFGESQGDALEAMERALTEEVCPVAQVPLLATTTSELEETIGVLAAKGVTNQSFYAVAEPEDVEPEVLSAWELPPVAARIEEAASEDDVRFLWEVPGLRRPDVALSDQVRAGPRAAGDVSIRVDPEGVVIPPRGPWRSAGNLLEVPWQQIWDHAAFRTFRLKVEVSTRCDRCPGLATCAPACPADPASWADDSGAEV